MSHVTVEKILSTEAREDAVMIMEEVFSREKRWIEGAASQVPETFGEHDCFSWFLARVEGEPAGLLRLWYDPPLEMPEEYEVTLEQGIDVEQLKAAGRYVEIGRFMILRKFRRNHRVALRLMSRAVREVLERDYTHFITDVFEDDPHSPLNFHTRVLGFEVIGRHLFGDLHCSSARIILTLDILKVYGRIRNNRSRIYRELTEGMTSLLERKLVRPGGQGI
ncbi:GNAT family N-acetyltransferase [Prosthecochloris vibrioformis]|uniref:GNAT family N-acetyltransferase n=1 Tax=Prosthecochloris vibrioformis TaxID=1098 RepID=A0A5C4RZG4_PROVB|nr:GNAT family N-acetyltransferase [Prosthecochloris vibrioformis]TNJ36087.1 GNAT family N-acetyltransferase [Prosthecochloris vibrioformis]